MAAQMVSSTVIVMLMAVAYICLCENTSQEKREMESYLYYLFTYIPYILNTNFEEEKSLYYNIECVKYLLNKENRIKDLSFKKILIDLINLFATRVLKLKKELNITNPMDVQILFNDKLKLLQL